MRTFLETQYQNLFLWSPFVIAFGAALYFMMPHEPAFSYPFIIAILSAAIVIFRKPNVLVTTFLLFVFGFFYANGYTKLINTPQISHDLRQINITGTVTNLDYTSDKPKVFIRVPTKQLDEKISGKEFATIRVSVNDDQPVQNIGDNIDATVTLFRPDDQSAPNSFDYARWAYFNGITATGYLNEYDKEPVPAINNYGINNLRNYLHKKTNSMLSDTLALGYKNAVPKTDMKFWTASGVGHVWSISGFHITLVSTWLFAFFYLIFRSISPITRKIPARYPAMIFAWAGLLFYLFLSGADVATVRAFLMTSLIFMAFIMGRSTFSLRNICIAFIAIFLINPHYVMQPGFQLSFAAIFGLIWYFDDFEYTRLSFGKKIIRTVWAAVMTSVIATLFTAPFVIYNFYSIQSYGLIGNLILLPVFSFAIMPLVIIGTIATLFGIHTPLIWASGIYNWTLGIAERISSLPYSQIQIPAVPASALFFMLIGFLCLMFIVNYNKIKINVILFLIFVSFGISIIVLNPRPIFYSTNDHELIGIVRDGKLEFNKARAANHFFAFESWKKLNFENPDTPNNLHKCAKGVCIFKTKNWTLAYAQKYVPLSENLVEFCNNPKIDFILSYFDVESEKCNHKILRGGFVIYKSGAIKYTPTNRWWGTRH
ncbi:MAG TPA: ComEC/Rec2 family competence protein [Alphaproteobacteria bacterium]|nr:ComEC/Rec2 family competence protein [Alphaproteobacteria bacterium]